MNQSELIFRKIVVWNDFFSIDNDFYDRNSYLWKRRVLVSVNVFVSISILRFFVSCNTAQHLCEDICFNQFMPINYTRYWQWQTISLGLVAMFLVWLIDAEKQEMELLDKLQGQIFLSKIDYVMYRL